MHFTTNPCWSPYISLATCDFLISLVKLSAHIYFMNIFLRMAIFNVFLDVWSNHQNMYIKAVIIMYQVMLLPNYVQWNVKLCWQEIIILWIWPLFVFYMLVSAFIYCTFSIFCQLLPQIKILLQYQEYHIIWVLVDFFMRHLSYYWSYTITCHFENMVSNVEPSLVRYTPPQSMLSTISHPQPLKWLKVLIEITFDTINGYCVSSFWLWFNYHGEIMRICEIFLYHNDIGICLLHSQTVVIP